MRAIELIGEALSTEVMVEGVETEAEFDYLRDHTKIRVAQGYYFGRPMMLTGVEGGVEWRDAGAGGPEVIAAARQIALTSGIAPQIHIETRCAHYVALPRVNLKAINFYRQLWYEEYLAPARRNGFEQLPKA